jgi:predicted secreted protein
VGASGKDIWTFKVTKAGTATILMNYSRPWEGVDKEEWTFKAIITVR